MKIYEIGTGYTPIPAQISAATEIVVEALSAALMDLGQDVTVVDIRTDSRPDTPFPILEVPIPRAFCGTDASLGLAHKAKRVIYSLSLGRVLRKILGQTRDPVIFHFHNQYNLFFFHLLTPPRLRNRCRIAYTNHSGIWRQDWDTIRPLIRRRYFQEAYSMRHADLVFLLNRETRNNVTRHLRVSTHRIRLIHNGVSTEVYRPLPKQEKEAAKAHFGLAGKQVFLQVGSVCDNKGQLRAIRELLPLLKSRPDVVYAYAGGIIEGDYQLAIQDYAQKMGIADQVRYLGMIAPGEALNRLYNTATATVLPSRYEAFGLVAVESLAAGIPVLLPADSPLDFGPGCVRYQPDALAATAETPLGEDITLLSSAARENALMHYRWEVIARCYINGFTDRMNPYA